MCLLSHALICGTDSWYVEENIKLACTDPCFETQVMFTMPLAPLVVNKTSGDWMWTAASVLSLHGSPSLEFDPALDVDFDGASPDLAKASGLSMLERYVAKLLEASFEDSSLFWHYAMRHVPSESLVCASVDHSSKLNSDGSFLSFVNDADIPPDEDTNRSILEFLPDNQTIPAYGYAAFSLGAAASTCFCGWARVPPPSTLCQIPTPICQDMQFGACTFDPATEEGRAALSMILDAWPAKAPSAQVEWPCPIVDLSDAWGIMGDAEAADWISKGSRSVRVSQVLRAGRAGLRMGNAKQLRKQAQREQVWPTERVHKLFPSDGGSASSGVALQRCANNIMQSFDPLKVVTEVVDDLFPVAQGIHESTPMSFCLRYAIEFSRLRMLRAVQSVAGDRQQQQQQQVAEEIRAQRSVVDRYVFLGT